MSVLKRPFVLLTALALMSTLAVGSGESAAAVRILGARVPREQLPVPHGISPQPALAGNSVAYAVVSSRLSQTDIFLANLATKRARRVARLGRGVSPLIFQSSRSWLVWMEGRDGRPGWQLWGLDLKDGRRRPIDSSATEGGPAAPGFPEFSLHGNSLAWVRHDCRRTCTRPGPSTLRLLDLRGGPARIVAHTSYLCRPISSPSLTEATLSWVGTPLSGYGCPAPTTWTVISRNRQSGRLRFHEIHLDRNQLADGFVGGDGWEAWTQHLEFTNRDERVHLVNLRSRVVQTISGVGGFSPRLAGHTLAWTAGNTVQAMDLRTGKRYLLDRGTSSPNLDTSPDIWLGQSWQNRVIWEESSFNPNGGPIHDSLIVATVP